MYYLVKTTLKSKKLLAISETDYFSDNQFWDCLTGSLFDDRNRKIIRRIQIRCINAPSRLTNADVYADC